MSMRPIPLRAHAHILTLDNHQHERGRLELYFTRGTAFFVTDAF